MKNATVELVPTGVEGLDAVLRGGLPRRRTHLVQGEAGTGKTTLGLQFILAGLAAGESCLYVSLAESEDELRQIARSHGWPGDELPLYYQEAVGGGEDEMQTVLHPAEIELPATLGALLEKIDAVRPARVVVDSLAELRILAREPRWFRHELRRLREKLDQLEATVLLIDSTRATPEAESLIGGVFRLHRQTPTYGPDRRRLEVIKVRGHAYETGFHDTRIRTGGLEVYPRLIAAEHRQTLVPKTRSSGLPELDAMLGGGLDEAAAVLLLGPTGSGKSSLAFQCVVAAAERGEKVLTYVFDERIHTLLQRCRGLGIELEPHLESGRLTLRQIDPAELTPGQLAHEVRRRVVEDGVQLLVLDTLNAYEYSMPGERLLEVHLHELLAFLSQQGVTSIMVATQHGSSTDVPASTTFYVSYLADTVVLLRTLSLGGRLHKALTVFKRRAGEHETAVRELRLTRGRIEIGDVLPFADLPADPQRPPTAEEGDDAGQE